jgi:hypothetical protein
MQKNMSLKIRLPGENGLSEKKGLGITILLRCRFFMRHVTFPICDVILHVTFMGCATRMQLVRHVPFTFHVP